ncbi:MAG: ATP-binding protein [Dehalococcoidales bacterium]
MSDKRTKILLIEDNPGDARLIQEMLAEVEPSRFELEWADRLSAGIKRLEQGDIDVILLDLDLPDSQGVDTFTKVYARAKEKPIVVFTGLADETVGIKAVRGGAQDYLVKGQVDGNLISRSIRYAIERKRMEQELKEKTRKLEVASQAKSQFLASMSHELRTPLNAIIGFTQLMLDEVPGKINDEQRDCLSDVLDSGQHLLNLVSDVLDLSKVEMGKIELKLRALNLTAVIADVTKTVKPMLDANKHELTVSMEEGLPQVRADKSRLRQTFFNLLSNAIKFTPPRGRIAIQASREGDWCQVSVVDNGPGIEKEVQERIFEIFTRSETLPDGKKGGTGLGLALTRQFVELMGGRIWLESEYGKGSRFTFTLPLARESKPYLEKG